MVMFPRQTGAAMSPADTSTSSMTSMASSMSESAASSTSTMSMTPSSTGSSGTKLSPAVIAVLAIIAVIVVSIFLGFWIHSKIRSHKKSKRGATPNSSQQLASQSLSVSTYVGATSTTSTVIAPRDHAPKQSSTDDLGMKKAANTPLAARDPEVRWVAQERPGHHKGTLSRTESTHGSPYLPASAALQETMPSAPVAPSSNPEHDQVTQPSSDPLISASPSVDPPTEGMRQKTPRPLPSVSAIQTHKKEGSTGSSPSTGHGNTGAPISEQRVSPSPRPLPKLPPPPQVPPQPPQALQPPQAPPPPQTSQPARAPVLARRASRSFLSFDDNASDSGSNFLNLDAPDSQIQQTQALLRPAGGKTKTGVAPSNIRLMNVIVPYEPELPDELELRLGDIVRLLREFDDGWCIVEYVGQTGKRPGAVPRMCLEARSVQNT